MFGRVFASLDPPTTHNHPPHKTKASPLLLQRCPRPPTSSPHPPHPRRHSDSSLMPTLLPLPRLTAMRTRTASASHTTSPPASAGKAPMSSLAGSMEEWGPCGALSRRLPRSHLSPSIVPRRRGLVAERGVFLRRDSVETLVVECSVIKCALLQATGGLLQCRHLRNRDSLVLQVPRRHRKLNAEHPPPASVACGAYAVPRCREATMGEGWERGSARRAWRSGQPPYLLRCPRSGPARHFRPPLAMPPPLSHLAAALRSGGQRAEAHLIPAHPRLRSLAVRLSE